MMPTAVKKEKNAMMMMMCFFELFYYTTPMLCIILPQWPPVDALCNFSSVAAAGEQQRIKEGPVHITLPTFLATTSTAPLDGQRR